MTSRILKLFFIVCLFPFVLHTVHASTNYNYLTRCASVTIAESSREEVSAPSILMDGYVEVSQDYREEPVTTRENTSKRWAVVNTSSCFLRIRPDYESSNETQCLMGTVLEVIESDRYWRKVNAPFYKNCWTNDLVLAYMTEEQKDEYEKSPKWICVVEHSHLYARPDYRSERMGDFEMCNIIRRSDSDDAASASKMAHQCKASESIEGAECGVDRSGWVEAITASGQRVWIPSSDVRRLEDWKASRVATQRTLVQTARRFIGTPYMWGGNTVNYFDCSGFVGFVYKLCGVELPRNAREQIDCGTEIPYNLDKMRPGDLIFYGRKATSSRPRSVTHVAMYIGEGCIIHSSQLVRISSIVPGTPDYYEREVVGVRRIVGK